MKTTKKTVLAAMMSALCVVILLLGSVITVLDLSTAALCALVVTMCVIEAGNGYAALVWLVASLIGFLLLPDKFGTLVFFAFCGYYPILKRYMERLGRLWGWIVKLICFNISLTLILAASRFLLGLPKEELGFSVWVYLLCNVVFVLFDIALGRMIIFYFVRLRDRFKF